MRNIVTAAKQTIITGGPVKKLMIAQGQKFSDRFRGQRVSIITVNPPYSLLNWPLPGVVEEEFYKHRSTKLSTKLKKKTLEEIGFEVEVVELSPTISAKDLSEHIKIVKQQSLGIIMQRPIPVHLGEAWRHIPENMDLDPILDGQFSGPVASETISRVVKTYFGKGNRVALVGGRGFVGRGVYQCLNKDIAAKQIMVIDKGDDLAKVKQADIVVAVSGVANLLDTRYILPHHRLLVTSGFVPMFDGSIKSDITPEAMTVPQTITPVPGGIGPLEMATLVERAALLAGVKLEPWKLNIHTKPNANVHNNTANGIANNNLGRA